MRDGFITLISVVLVSAMGLAISLSILSSGIDTTISSEVKREGTQAVLLADACIDLALQQIHDSTPYTGTETINFGSTGSCTYTVASQGGGNRTIDASGTVSDSTRKIEVVIDQVNPTISISRYEAVADF